MKLVLVVFAACVIGVSSRYTGSECNRSGVWFDGCNYCRCSDDKAVICTLKYCPPKPVHIQGGGGPQGASVQASGGSVSIPEGQGFQVCIQVEPWYDGCNWCSCRDGLTMCTQRTCIPEGVDGTK